MRRRFGILVLALLASQAQGCGGKKHQATFVHPMVDLGAIRTVAVLPFENMTGNPEAASKVHGIFLIELLSTGAFDVIEPGRVTKVLQVSGIKSTESLDSPDFQNLSKELGVDGLFLGTVVDFAEVRSGNTPAPEVSIQVRLVESVSGVTVWSNSDSKSGATLSRQLIGVGGQSLTEATHEVVRRQLETLFP